MGRFLIKILIAFVLPTGLILGTAKLISLPVERQNFENTSVESNLFWMGKDQEYDYLIMGISHARNFSRYQNHGRVEKLLNGRMINIGLGGGICGATGQNLYLKYFFCRGNTTRKVIYVLSPPMMFAANLDRSADMLINEPLKLDFLIRLLFSKGPGKGEQLYYYIRHKFTRKWLEFEPNRSEYSRKILPEINDAAIQEGFDLAYPEGLDSLQFEWNKGRLKETIEVCKKNHSAILFIIAPTVFGKWPGNDACIEFLKELKLEYGTEYYDFSESIQNLEYYSDHHHLNTPGIEFFTENYLLPVLK